MLSMGDMSGGGSVWELDDDEEDEQGGKLERVGDLSPNGSFGRCLVYRIDVSQLLQVCIVLFVDIACSVVSAVALGCSKSTAPEINVVRVPEPTNLLCLPPSQPLGAGSRRAGSAF